jgi:hypothetical protein
VKIKAKIDEKIMFFITPLNKLKLVADGIIRNEVAKIIPSSFDDKTIPIERIIKNK